MILHRKNDLLSSRDISMLVYVRDRVHRQDPPTFEEIAAAHRCSVRLVIAAMRRLKQHGFLTWDPLFPRSWQILSSQVDSPAIVVGRSSAV